MRATVVFGLFLIAPKTKLASDSSYIRGRHDGQRPGHLESDLCWLDLQALELNLTTEGRSLLVSRTPIAD
jgi:hypothetical protein